MLRVCSGTCQLFLIFPVCFSNQSPDVFSTRLNIKLLYLSCCCAYIASYLLRLVVVVVDVIAVEDMSIFFCLLFSPFPFPCCPFFFLSAVSFSVYIHCWALFLFWALYFRQSLTTYFVDVIIIVIIMTTNICTWYTILCESLYEFSVNATIATTVHYAAAAAPAQHEVFILDWLSFLSC